jgi:hypothetical protein
MAICGGCGNKLGLFAKTVRLDKTKFCPPCAEAYFQQRRRKGIDQVLSLQPRCLFVLPKVRTRDPDRPGSRHRLIGLTAFTDKGVCFVNLGTHQAADPGWGHLFGLIGALVSEMSAKKEMATAFAQAESVMYGAQDFAALLNRSRQVLFYPLPKVDLVKIGAGWVTVRHEKKKIQFQVHGTRKEFKQVQAHAKAYCDAVKRGIDPASSMPPDLAAQA